MNLLNGRLYNTLEFICNLFLLNLLWIICCLPIVTIFPATAAMFGVIRQWSLNKDDKLLSTFLLMFKNNFKQSFLIGILWWLTVGILYLDSKLIHQFDSTLSIVLNSGLTVFTTIVVFTSIFMFPVMVHYQLNWFGIFKQSFFFSFIYFPSTIMLLLLLAISCMILFVFPMLFLNIFSLVAFIIFKVCKRKFDKVYEMAKVQTDSV